ncbi:hypothetical protein KFE98_21280 [bacterium SCSIO 12741]|nr:hypothetical protein KFE98_21280 [bacterium SCSIO 12741]
MVLSSSWNLVEMDLETARYIFNYFAHLLSPLEQAARRHASFELKLEGADRPKEFRRYKEMGWLTDDAQVLNLLKDGFEAFQVQVAERILVESPESVYLNLCPSCGQLTRTPQARQCRHCGHDWHDQIVGKFKWNSCFEITPRSFFLVGMITRGKVHKGNFLDLSGVGLAAKPKIRLVESVQLRKQGRIYEEIGLGVATLNEWERSYLKKIGYFKGRLDILRELD